MVACIVTVVYAYPMVACIVTVVYAYPMVACIVTVVYAYPMVACIVTVVYAYPMVACKQTSATATSRVRILTLAREACHSGILCLGYSYCTCVVINSPPVPALGSFLRLTIK